ncbi:hypothetical protein AAFF_G00252640 [Aldrovandia affinis]|uniref:Uncharacterized protein n=1 Tax=Aldrovandia affinis TaxID=143900 RepID=A0AAD7WUD7_9TELE|nr:hypothetical protein AAFF_G00252640 [Aldrovandia affinis]
MHSDGDTATTPPHLFSPDATGSSRRQDGAPGSDASAGRRDESRHAEREDGRSDAKQPGPAETPAPPPVGTWEFELLDEEYPRFLELFLSYVLERDRAREDDSAPPLLSCFSARLRERELHSLAFDVLTTFRRRQREQRHAAGRKRGGGGHRPALRPLPPPPPPPSSTPSLSIQSGAPIGGRAASGVPLLPGLRAGKPQGLFGLRQQSRPVGLPPAPGTRAGSEASQSSAVRTPQSDHSALPTPDALELRRELDAEPTEARFQDLGRLLEWMVRWADRRVLPGHPTRTRSRGAGAAGEGVVMRVKASTSAVLTALRVLERRYSAALLGTDKNCPYFRVPEGEFIVAPVQPEVVRKMRSEDPAYAASPGSPTTLPLQETPHDDSESSEVEEVESEMDLGGELHQYGQQGATPDPENGREGVTPDPEKGPGGSEDERLSCPAEPEGDSGALGAWEAEASCISVKIRALPRASSTFQDQTLTLADLESNTDETQGDLSQAVESGSVQLPVSMPTSESADIMAELAATTLSSRLYSPTSDGATGTSPVLHLHPGPQIQSHHPGNAPQPGRAPDPQPPLALSDPIRQLIHDESFRLMQFQHMSFINLMQVMGSSFANLPHAHPNLPLSHPNPPLAQPNLPLAQPNLPLLNHTQQPGAAFLHPTPQASDPTGPQNWAPAALPRVLQPSAGRPDRHRFLNPVSLSQGHRDIENITEDIQDFPVRSRESRGRQAERGLNTTPHESTHTPPGPHQGLPLLCPGRSQGGSSAVPPVTTIRLLQLHPPPTLLQWPAPQTGLQWPPPPVTTSTSLLQNYPATPLPREASAHSQDRDDPVTLTTEERTKAGERAFAVPQNRVSPEPYVHTTLGQADEEGVPPSACFSPPVPPTPLPQGLPLLHFDPSPSHVALATSSRPLASGLGGPTHCPGIQLLQTDPEPPSKGLPLAFPSHRAPHLIPLEVLMGWAAQGQRAPPTGIAGHRLLTGDTQTGLADSNANFSKRQKRREERRMKGASTKATFRLEGSSAPPTEPEKVEPSGCAVEEGFVMSAEPVSSTLEVQSLVSRALSTAAELHAFASKHKRPPEIQDVSTNTDPVAPGSITDKAVSAQLPVCQTTPPANGGLQTEVAAAPLCPEVFLNLQFPVEQVVDVHGAGRRFLNVIDLEDEALLLDLPSLQTSAPETGPPLPPSPSRLHPHAASASSPAPDAQLESSPPLTVQAPVWEPARDMATLGLLMEAEVRSPTPLARQRADKGAEESGSQDYANSLNTDTMMASPRSIADHVDRGLANARMPIGAMETFDLRDERERRYDWRVGVGETEDGFDTMTEMSGKEKSGKFDDRLGLSDAAGLIRLGEQRREVRTDQERRKVRAWMRKKQRERLVEYCRQREERREREHKPFTPSTTKNPSSKDISLNMKMKEKNERRLRLEHHTQRAHDACSLISELLTTTTMSAVAMAPTLRSVSQGTHRAAARRCIKPDGRRGRSAHFQTPPRRSSPGRASGPQSRATPGRPHTHGNHLGLHRPASALPRDRLSQVTRRGMLADPRARGPAKDWGKGVGPSLTESSRMEEEDLREVVSPWNPPLEIRRMLGLEEPNPGQEVLDEGNESTVGESATWLKRLESLSESTGSILSKLDWTAIENMVAEEDGV